jgi:hypothetical protein
MPSGWDKTRADLVTEVRSGKRGPLSDVERFWGRQYERALVRASMPAGWNKTTSDLSDEVRRGERESMGHPEMEWAWEYARSLIPSDMRFPREGDVYEALEDMPAKYMTAWRAPFTGGGDTVICKGDYFRVDHDPPEPDSIGVYVVAVEYEELELRTVPQATRNNPKYNGFYFPFGTVMLNEKFRLVHED